MGKKSIYLECPVCHRYIPHIQPVCDCGHHFSGKERQYKTCPKCGSFYRRGRILCDCGHILLFDKSEISRADIDAAYQSGFLAGITHERRRKGKEQKASRQAETRYFVETEDGFSLSVPESKLASWQRAQLDPPSPLSRSEELLKRKIMERLYGPGKADDPK